ncbi:hypothetical protein MCOR25_000078 [Pyricularia grisea]|nr:hypothetical protein MCOR25_000078 [Pyricularia grisea]
MAEADAPSAPKGADTLADTPSLKRRGSSSQQSETSQTAAEFIREQMQLEADAREALPYSIKDCTKSLGPLRQAVFSCLTCNPPPSDPKAPYDAAGVCYACSIQCHGEHTLVEIFTKRNFTCDCGTTRFSSTNPCSLRVNPETNSKGVHSETASTNNYNHNFRNRFCGCECDYDPFEQKGTMFQCLGLGTHETGGCGEDWWHPGCLVGLGPAWFENMEIKKQAVKVDTGDASVTTKPLETISEDTEATNGADSAAAGPTNADPPAAMEEGEDDDPPMPPGFPEEDAFESFLCYKCVDAYPWVKRYASSQGFLPPVFSKQTTNGTAPTLESSAASPPELGSQKRKAEDDGEDAVEVEFKRHKTEEPAPAVTSTESRPDTKPADKPVCKINKLPPAPSSQFSLFFKEDFREHLCRCEACFPLLKPHPQLLEEEETYEPPVSEDGNGSEHGSTQGSLLEMGESALRNVDRVRAIEGVMAYNHLKDKLKTFLQPFAQSGEAVSAEHIKEIFAKMRGDDEAIKEAAEGAKKSSDNRREQSGY